MNLKLMSVSELAEILDLAQVTVRKKIARREIEIVRIGRSVKIPLREVERLIERGTIPAAPERAR